MTDKAYIVANKEQELDVLKKLEENRLVWIGGERPTEWVTSEELLLYSFPYMLIEREEGKISWSAMDQLENRIIVYDGRKEGKMYKVTQEFMHELVEWRDSKDIKPEIGKLSSHVDYFEISHLPFAVRHWWKDEIYDPFENNRRLIAIIQWLNGEDVFEVEEPHKFVVRSDKNDRDGDYTYILVERGMTTTAYILSSATKFNTREEAQEWANSHQVVVEIDEEGNDVE